MVYLGKHYYNFNFNNLYESNMIMTDREVIERSSMYITNASNNFIRANYSLKYKRGIQKLSTIKNILYDNQGGELNNNNNVKNSFGLHRSGQNHRQLFLQPCDMKLNVKKENVISENIKGVCDIPENLFVDALLSEKTSCIYQMKDGKKESYFTFYEKDRIYCKREGKEDYEWEIPLDDEAQYDKVMLFLSGLEDRDNLSFTIHNTFWQDFLSGKLDVEDFREFLSTCDREEISNGFHISEDGSVPGKETMKYAGYIYGPSFGAHMMRTTEELWKWQEKQAEKITEEWRKTFLSWVEQWNKEHPDLVGVKCIRHANGQWYTAEEIYKLWVEELKSDGTVFINS